MPQAAEPANRLRSWLIWPALVVLALASWGQLKQLDRHSISPTASDLAQVWVGVHRAFRSADPYAPEATREIQRIYYGQELDPSDTRVPQRFAYPLDIAVVLAPMAVLSWPATKLLYLCVLPWLMAATVPIWLGLLNLPATGRQKAMLVALVMLSWPMVWGIRLEQITLLVAAFLVAACWLLRSGQQTAAGILLSLATIKPQIALPLAAWLLFWSILNRRWWFIISFTTAAAALLGAAQVLQPGWLPRWIAALHDYSHFTEMKPILVLIFGRFLGAALILILAAFACSLLWRMRACRIDSQEFASSCALVLALTACLLPPFSGMIYNQVLLLPGLLLLLHPNDVRTEVDQIARNVVRFLLALGYLSVVAAFAGASLWGPAKGWLALPFLDLILPVCTAIALCLLLRSRLTETAPFVTPVRDKLP